MVATFVRSGGIFLMNFVILLNISVRFVYLICKLSYNRKQLFSYKPERWITNYLLMKKLFVASCLILLVVYSSYSQDVIWLKDGQKLNCKVRSEDSTSVYFDIRMNGFVKKTFIDKSSIDSIKFNHHTDISSERIEKSSIGFGIGLDHGGYGANLVFYPGRNFGIFGGLGYAFAGIGYNAGLKIKLVGVNHKTHVYPYLLGMYGYNAAIAISNAKQYSKFFYGPSFGLGFDIRQKWERRGYLTIALILPLRKKDVRDYYDLMEQRGVEFSNDLLPFAFSVGYHIIMN